MNDKSESQVTLWVGLAILALLGVGLMAFLAGRLLSGATVTATPIALPPTSTPLPPPVVTIQGLKSQAELSTVEQTAVAEIYNENIPDGWLDDFLGTKEQILILAYGEVRAGFDLEKIKEEDLWTDGSSVRLVLPAPEILNSSLDFERTRIVYYENSLILDDGNPNLQGEALGQAKKAIEKAALEANILNQANDFGQLYFENFLYSLGFTDVEVIVDAQIFKE